jgi:protein SCO1/2
MTGSAVKYWLILACALATMYGSFIVWRREHSPSSAVAQARVAAPDRGQPPLEDFVLTDQAGQQFDSASLRGKVWVGSFFFTNCPAVCWRLNQTLAALQETNPTSEARYVSITCDPANDTPAALARYAAHFKADPARWTFLTGDMNLIRRIGNDRFKVAVETETHSDRAFVVDRAGRVRGRFRLTEPNQVEMLKKVLAAVEDEPTVEAEPATPAQPAADSPPAPAAASAPVVPAAPEAATDASGGA